MKTAEGLTAGVDVEKKKGITGSTLKIIAIVAMFIDHFAAIVMDRYLFAIGFYVRGTDGSIMGIDPSIPNGMLIYWLDVVLRLIGRIGFPIFCFLLIEGFIHTRCRWKYLLRLAIFAFVSEIPFDLAFGFMGESYQNVFFTLAIGFAVIWGIDAATGYIERKIQKKSKDIRQIIIAIVITVAGFLLAEALHTDYSGMGIVTIAIMYWLHKYQSKISAMVGGCVVLVLKETMEFTAFATVPLIAKYNGERGLKLKYVFYLFYPLHILFWHLVCLWMGI